MHAVADWLRSLNLLDWILLSVVLLSAVFGIMRGIIRSLFSVIGLILGVLLAGWYCGAAAKYLSRWITSPVAARAAAFIAIAVVVMIASVQIGLFLRGAVSMVGLGFADRSAGGLFGLVRAYLLIAALLIPLAPYLREMDGAKTSVLLPCFLSGAHGISFVLPQDLKQQIVIGIRRLNQSRS